jgi:epoxyqueuosine reductase
MSPKDYDWQNELEADVVDFVTHSPLNRLAEIDDSPIWDPPLVGFADGDDPLFDLLLQVVGSCQQTPRTALAERFGSVSAPEIAVVSWVLPAAGPTRASNRQMVDGPSQRWNHTRFRGEAFNNLVREHVEQWFRDRSVSALAPVLTPNFSMQRAERGLASPWSERHIAYIAGLGTFGLSDGLITARGIAHRLGSVVAETGCRPTPRPYSSHHAYCTFYQSRGCQACIRRCPVGAISDQGHDKEACRTYIFETLGPWAKKPGYMGDYGACGLCQTGVPCEATIPGRINER